MRIQSKKPAAITNPPSETAKPAAAKTATPSRAAGWSGGAGNVARDVHAALTHPQGRETFAELLENHLSDPNSGIGYAWDPGHQKPMQWSLRNSEMGEDTLLVQVRGKELIIQSDNSGFEGKATFTGSSREALDTAIRAAVKDLDAVTERNRGR